VTDKPNPKPGLFNEGECENKLLRQFIDDMRSAIGPGDAGRHNLSYTFYLGRAVELVESHDERIRRLEDRADEADLRADNHHERLKVADNANKAIKIGLIVILMAVLGISGYLLSTPIAAAWRGMKNPGAVQVEEPAEQTPDPEASPAE